MISLLVAIFVILTVLFGPSRVSAQTQAISQNQVERPDSKYLFTEDSSEYKKAEKKTQAQYIRPEAAAGEGQLDFKAPEVNYSKEKSVVSGRGGVLISGMGIQAQAEEGSLNLDTKEADLHGGVVLTEESGVIKADSIKFNLDTETGTFRDTSFMLEEGGYGVRASQVDKLSEYQYRLFNSSMSTCGGCGSGTLPWEIRSRETDITQEGYAHSYGATFNLLGVPVLWTPWLGFPAKTERASGLLAPSVGYSSNRGLLARVPVFAVIDDSSDALVTPFTESRARNGSELDYRTVFSDRSRFMAHAVYSNERPRDGDLLGTLPAGIFVPPAGENDDFYAIDSNGDFTVEDRYGFSVAQKWATPPDSDINMGLYSNIYYVSDNLFLREMEDPKIGDRQLQYTTSTITGRANLGDSVLTEISGEYNQSLVSDDSLTLQRLPEASIDGFQTFRPFGFNPLGLRLLARGNVTTTNFTRDSGYDGWRTNFAPGITVPFRFRNYLENSVDVSANRTYYNLRNEEVPNSARVLDPSQERTVGRFSYTAQTAVERVYNLEEGNLLTYVTSIGARNQDNVLRRVKHVIEPLFNFSYIPNTTGQDDLPFFDEFDRYRPKSLFTYGATTSLLGRFTPRAGTAAATIPELTPRVQDLPIFGLDQPLEDFGGMTPGNPFNVSLRQGEIRELAAFGIKQSYNYRLEGHEPPPPGPGERKQHPYSDIGTFLGIFPTRSVGLYADSNYDPYENEISSWSLSSSVRTDRGDSLRAKFTYIRGSLSNIEGNAEAILTDRLKIGYYARYDDLEGQMVEDSIALRLYSACDCWHLDLGYRDTINPDRQMYLVTVNFGGLGDLTQDILVRRDTRQRQD